MSRSNLFTQAFQDLADDIAYYAMGLAHGAFDLTCVVALGLMVYASGLDGDGIAGQDRPMVGVQASVDGTGGLGVSSSHAPSSCSLTNDLLTTAHGDCITAMVLDPLDA